MADATHELAVATLAAALITVRGDSTKEVIMDALRDAEEALALHAERKPPPEYQMLTP